MQRTTVGLKRPVLFASFTVGTKHAGKLRLCYGFVYSLSDSHAKVTPSVFPPMTASSSQFNVEGVKELSCVCICQCVCMFESGPNVRDCAYVCMPPSVYCHREVSARVKQPTLKQELSPRWLSDASVCVFVLIIPQVCVCVCGWVRARVCMEEQ